MSGERSGFLLRQGAAVSVLAGRERVVVELLSRYTELVDPAGRSGEPGSGELPPHMPGTYTKHVRELERLLTVMRDEDRNLWWHVTERFIRCSHVLRDVDEHRKTKNGKRVTIVERRLKAVIHPGVSETRVAAGVSWIAGRWDARRIGEPCLPRELLVAA